MAATSIRNNDSSIREKQLRRNIFARLWNSLGLVLQTMHQNRRNAETYSLLLQNDDYLLRDIGVSRENIMKMSEKTGIYDAGKELEKLRSTQGRFSKN